MRDRIQAIIGDCEEEVVEETFDLLNGGVIVHGGVIVPLDENDDSEGDFAYDDLFDAYNFVHEYEVNGTVVHTSSDAAAAFVNGDVEKL